MRCLRGATVAAAAVASFKHVPAQTSLGVDRPWREHTARHRQTPWEMGYISMLCLQCKIKQPIHCTNCRKIIGGGKQAYRGVGLGEALSIDILD